MIDFKPGWKSLRASSAMLLLLAACTLSDSRCAFALPAGYSASTIDLATPNAVLAYAPDGTRYVVEAVATFGSSTTTLKVVNPNGSVAAPITVTGTTFQSTGGAWWDTVSGRLLVTDNFPGRGSLVSIDPTTGAATAIFTGLAAVSDVVVRSSGEIFVSDGSGSGAGAVYQVSRANGALSSVFGGLDFAAGLGFDSAGNMIVQEAFLTGPFTTEGRVYRLPISGSPGNLIYGAPDILANNMTAAFDLAVDSENDIFVTGAGGLFKIAAGSNAVTSFDTNGSPFQFATGIAFFAGANPFEPGSTSPAGNLTYISDFNHAQLRDISPVPEPATLALAAVGLGAVFVGRRVRRHCERQQL